MRAAQPRARPMACGSRHLCNSTLVAICGATYRWQFWQALQPFGPTTRWQTDATVVAVSSFSVRRASSTVFRLLVCPRTLLSICMTSVDILAAVVVASIAGDSAGLIAALILGPNLLELPRPACVETMRRPTTKQPKRE